jgi:hypothetical protein
MRERLREGDYRLTLGGKSSVFIKVLREVIIGKRKAQVLPEPYKRER